MPDHAKVDDTEIFSRFRVALIRFAQAASEALSSADGEVARTHSWLETEQRAFWEGQLRKRTEAVTKAREAVRQKKLYKDSSGRTPSAAEEEKALAKCIAAVQHAEERIQSIRKWLPKLERAAGLYRGGVAGLNKAVGDDVPRAIALLDRLAESLHEYLQIESVGGAAPESATSPAEETSMAREGEAAPAVAAEPPVPPAKEGPDVPVGQ